MKIQHYVVGPIQTNVYFVMNEETKEMLLIDPAPGSTGAINLPEKEGYELIGILLTHAHWDHMDGAEAFHEKYGAPRILLKEETRTATDSEINLSGALSGMDSTYEWDSLVSDGQVVTLGGFTFTVIHTPGHTPGGACFYFEKEGVLFSGDALFEQSIGRTDFPGGSMSDLVRSLSAKVLTLPDETRVLPGHGGETTIGFEKRYNPYLSDGLY